MKDFRYVTRGESSPQGKPRVYFTAHPDDYERNFEPIVKEILDRHNCAVFRLGGNTLPDEVEDFELRVGGMQLFVVPVTTKLLTAPSRAMDIDVPFAIAHHIPVLPLMQETGLDELFVQRFGDLQYLNKYDADPTAISYDEKLTRYLEAVIVGDESAKQVRAAFNAYIFLSYRKKDRKYAQELMRLIHAHPLCRDVAIWYDEFLTPGEDFNDEIRAALEKSELFALAVTPNLISESNYILTIEYPLAREMGKDILAAEMLPTDRGKLCEMYTGIPEPVGAKDAECLTERLQALVSRFADKGNDSDPRHNYYIGLAYLSGIDVEVDQKRAVELITSAAEAGFADAIDKLVTMYNTGEGVERDYHKAVEWQLKAVDVRERQYRDFPDADHAYVLMLALLDLGDAYSDLRLFEEAEAVCYRFMLTAERSYHDYRDYHCRRMLSHSYQKLGDAACMQGKLRAAKSYYEKGIEFAGAAARETGTPNMGSDLSRCYNKVGDFALSQGSCSDARKYYQNALKIDIVIARQMRTPEKKCNLAITYDNLGDVAFYEEKYEEALSYYLKSYHIKKAVMLESDTAYYRREYSVSCHKCGLTLEITGQFHEARQNYLEELDICEALAGETATLTARRDLLSCYQSHGRICENLEELCEAQTYYEKGVEIAEKLLQEANTAQARRDVAVSCSKLGCVLEKQGRGSEALTFHQRARELCEESVRIAGTVDRYDDLAYSYYCLGCLKKDRALLEHAMSIWKQLSEICPEVPSYPRKKEMAIDAIRRLFGG